MQDLVAVIVVPGLGQSPLGRSWAEKWFLESCPLGPSFPVVESSVLATLFSGRCWPAEVLARWTGTLQIALKASSETVEETVEEKDPVWIWDHLRWHRPGASAWVNLGPRWGANSPELPTPKPPGIRLSPSVEDRQSWLHLAQTLCSWVLGPLEQAWAGQPRELVCAYVPVVLMAAYVQGLQSPAVEICAQEVVRQLQRFFSQLESQTQRGQEWVWVLVDPWGLEEVKEQVSLPEVLHELGLTTSKSPGRWAQPWRLHLEQQVAWLRGPLPSELLARRGRSWQASSPELLGIKSTKLEHEAHWALTCGPNRVFTHWESARQEGTAHLEAWQLSRWLAAWAVEVPGPALPQATHGRSAQEEELRGRIWVNQPGLLPSAVLADLDLAGLVLSHWGI